MSQILEAYRESRDKFTYKYCDKVIEFFDIEPYEAKEIKSSRGGVDIKLVPAKPPLFERFASTIGISSRVLNLWRDRYEEFDRACEIAQDLQEYIIVTNSLMGLYEKTFAKMFVKNKLGWKESIEQTVDNKISIEGLMDRISKDNNNVDFIEQKNSALKVINL